MLREPSAASSNFYPRSPCGERRTIINSPPNEPQFLSTLSLRRATLSQRSDIAFYYRFLSTLSLRRATWDEQTVRRLIVISIHALLAESDGVCARRGRSQKYFYPRSPCGERRLYTAKRTLVLQISIHALLAESDSPFLRIKIATAEFLSTLSLRRATRAILRALFCR